jgi:trigger factor
VRPIDQPEIHFDDPLDEEQGFKFSATVEVRPEAELGDYKGVKVPRHEVEVSEEDVEARLEELRGQFATLAAIEERPAQDGDFVILDFSGERLTGGSIEGAQAEDYMLEIGRGELLPDFEQNIVGMEAGGRKQFGVTFPVDYAEESLRGESVLFNVHVKEIKERELPPLDDEFVKEASEFETLDELRAAVREQLEAAAEQRVDGEFRGRVLDVVAEGVEVEVPEVMVHEKAHEMVDSFERSIRAQGMDPEQYYQLAGTNHHEFEERVSPDAEDTVKKELVLDAVATAEGIVADEEEVMHEIGNLAEDTERSPEDVAEAMRTNGTYSMLEEEISRQKALDFLVENATPVPMPEEEEAEADEELVEAEEPLEESAEEPVEAKAVATENDEREEQA